MAAEDRHDPDDQGPDPLRDVRTPGERPARGQRVRRRAGRTRPSWPRRPRHSSTSSGAPAASRRTSTRSAACRRSRTTSTWCWSDDSNGSRQPPRRVEQTKHLKDDDPRKVWAQAQLGPTGGGVHERDRDAPVPGRPAHRARGPDRHDGRHHRRRRGDHRGDRRGGFLRRRGAHRGGGVAVRGRRRDRDEDVDEGRRLRHRRARHGHRARRGRRGGLGCDGGRRRQADQGRHHCGQGCRTGRQGSARHPGPDGRGFGGQACGGARDRRGRRGLPAVAPDRGARHGPEREDVDRGQPAVQHARRCGHGCRDGHLRERHDRRADQPARAQGRQPSRSRRHTGDPGPAGRPGAGHRRAREPAVALLRGQPEPDARRTSSETSTAW